MWKKDDAKYQGVAESSLGTVGFLQSSDSSSALSGSPKASASISQGIRIKGEVTGTEDLFVDGFVEGKLNLTANCCLTVGPNGNVQTDRLTIEDGATLRGKVEAGKFEVSRPAETKTAAAAAAANTSKPSPQPPALDSETAAD